MCTMMEWPQWSGKVLSCFLHLAQPGGLHRPLMQKIESRLSLCGREHEPQQQRIRANQSLPGLIILTRDVLPRPCNPSWHWFLRVPRICESAYLLILESKGDPDVLEDTVPPYRGIFVSATKLFTISGAPRPFERSQREFLTKRICYLFEFQGCTWRVRPLSPPPLGQSWKRKKEKGGFLITTEVLSRFQLFQMLVNLERVLQSSFETPVDSLDNLFQQGS